MGFRYGREGVKIGYPMVLRNRFRSGLNQLSTVI